MDDIQYQILTLIEQANSKRKPITYMGVINTLTKNDKIKEAVMINVQALMKAKILECNKNNKLILHGPLTLTKFGEKIYKKEYKIRNPKPLSKWRKVVDFIVKHIRVLLVNTSIAIVGLIVAEHWSSIKTICHLCLNLIRQQIEIIQLSL